MTTQTEALKLALEALENSKPREAWFGSEPHDQAIAAIKEALAQPEQGNIYGYASRLATAIWQKHYMKDAPKWKPLNTIEGVLTQIDNMTCGLVKEKQAQPEQEPVAWIVHDRVASDRLTFVEVKESLQTEVTPLYTTPPQRKPLTRAVVWKLWCDAKFESAGFFWLVFARAIEAAHGIKGEA